MKIVVQGPVVLQFVDEMLHSVSDAHAHGMGLQEDGKIIAGVKFDDWNRASVCMHVAARPGANWMTREYLFACFDYAFNCLSVRKIIGCVASNNAEARRFDEHLGFALETKITDAVPGGDLLLYTMTRQQCRFLKDHHG